MYNVPSLSKEEHMNEVPEDKFSFKPFMQPKLKNMELTKDNFQKSRKWSNLVLDIFDVTISAAKAWLIHSKERSHINCELYQTCVTESSLRLVIIDAPLVLS